MEPKYPHVKVKLTGTNGNAFVIMGVVSNALRKAKVPEEEIKKYGEESISGDYDNLLQTAFKWVTVR